MRWLLPLLVLAACTPFEPDDTPGSRLDGRDVVAQWTADPFPWNARVTGIDDALEATPGGTWSVDYDLEVDLRKHEARFGTFKAIHVGVLGEWRHDAEGTWKAGAVTFALTSNFTTTGVAVERWDGWPRFRSLHGKEGSPFEGTVRHELTGDVAADHRWQGTLTVQLPEDTPPGWYEPRLWVLVEVEGVADPIHLGEYSYEWNDWAPPVLPLVQVGQAATPKDPWTILAEYPVSGRVGILPRELDGKVGLVGRSGFRSGLILRPGRYVLQPSMPSMFPRDAIPRIDGGDAVMPEQLPNFLQAGNGEVTARVLTPQGEVLELGSKRFQPRQGPSPGGFDGPRGEPPSDRGARGGGMGPEDPKMGPEQRRMGPESGPSNRDADRGTLGEGTTDFVPRPELAGGGWQLDLTTTGRYEIELNGWMGEAFGRRVEGGGTYVVDVAMPLSMSTSCKPGTSFLTGDRYPSKVNVNPPFPADVTVRVDFLPGSDPAKTITWTGEGKANQYGHFVAYDTPPLVFEEPGEYVSTVEIAYRDARGTLWQGRQISSGVVAPREPGKLHLHGSRSFPFQAKAHDGAADRFENRRNLHNSFLPQINVLQQDPYTPFHNEDTLFMPVTFSEETVVQPKFSYAVRGDDALARELTAHQTRRSAMPIPWNQPQNDWTYLTDVVDISTDSWGYYPVIDGVTDEIPVASASDNGWHPFGFPQTRSWEAYTYVGVVRPGFPVLTSAFEVSPKGFYWIGSPNKFGHQFNAGLNGDSLGDVYRNAAGMVLKNKQTGETYYDAYASTVSFREEPEAPGSVSILPPGERVLRTANLVDHQVFLASDTHDLLQVGELLALGGVVMPVVEADVQWKITKPSGEVAWMHGTADRLGKVAGKPLLPVDEPGLYRIEPTVKWGELEGTLPGIVNQSFWHAALPLDNPEFLTTDLPGRTTVDAVQGRPIGLQWPDDLTDVTLHFGVIMPGAILDQGSITPRTNEWTYHFQPMQWAAQATNYDARNYATGEWTLAETMVFQFFLEGTRDGERVMDGVRLFLRKDQLYNYRALLAGPP